jgi:type II secretory pathway component PulF
MAGEIVADSHDDALARLGDRGVTVVELTRTDAGEAVKLSADELNFFNRQLGDLADANLPLAPALRELARDVKRGRLSRLFERLADDVASGRSLDEAVERHAGAFPPLYAQLI